MVQLLRFPVCSETVAVLRVLLKLALSGELRGLAVCYRRNGRADEVILTGPYKVRPENALGAALRMKSAACTID